MTDFSKLSISSAIKGLNNKDFTSVELTKYYIKKIQENSNLNCFITPTFETALEMAKKSDENITKKEQRSLERTTRRRRSTSSPNRSRSLVLLI